MHVFKNIIEPKLVTLLKEGAVGVLPTDTVYGLIGRAADKAAADKLFAIKQREHKAGTILAASVQQLVDLGLKARYVKAVEGFWPNPLSVVIPCDDTLAYLHFGTHSLAVRIPDDVKLRQLLEQTGALVTTSANPPGKQTAKNYHEAFAYFGDQVDFYVDAGDFGSKAPSTVIRIVDDAIEVLRQGAVKIDEAGRIST